MTSNCVVQQEFDTLAFGVPFYRVTEVASPKIESCLKPLIGRTPVIIDAKLPAEQTLNGHYLQGYGFRKICTQVAFTHDLANLQLKEVSAKTVRKLNFSERIIRKHARNFVFDRFNLDPDIPKKGKLTLYVKWIRNSTCLGRKEIVHLGDNFCSFSEEEDILVIDLVSVLDKGKRVGAKLLTGFLNEAILRKKQGVEVITECENYNAWQLYTKAGFQVSHYFSVYHYVNI